MAGLIGGLNPFGGGGAAGVEAAPSSPSSYDVEFSGDVLDSKLTQSFTASATPIAYDAVFSTGDPRVEFNAAQFPGTMAVQPPRDGSLYFWTQPITLATDHWVEMRFGSSVSLDAEDYMEATLQLDDGSSDDRVILQWRTDAPNIQVDVGHFIGGVSQFLSTEDSRDIDLSAHGKITHLGFLKIGTDFHLYTLDEGRKPLWWRTADHSTGATLNRMLFRFRNAGGASQTPGNPVAWVKHIRTVEADRIPSTWG